MNYFYSVYSDASRTIVEETVPATIGLVLTGSKASSNLGCDGDTNDNVNLGENESKETPSEYFV